MAKMTKRYKKAFEGLDREKLYSLDEAVKLVKANAKAKFDETLDLAVNLNLDTRQADQQIRGMLVLPNGTGKTARVAVFARDANADIAKKAGADMVGAEDLMEEIKSGNTNFDVCIATPDMMGIVGRLGKILGPKGLMPNPKLGTVTPNVEKAVKDAKGGSVEYRAEKEGIVHVGVGKASFTEKALTENIQSLMDRLVKAKPSGTKGVYMKKISLSSSMGPSVQLDTEAFMGSTKAA
jgi:large subunit ribosomal protein L1